MTNSLSDNFTIFVCSHDILIFLLLFIDLVFNSRADVRSYLAPKPFEVDTTDPS